MKKLIETLKCEFKMFRCEFEIKPFHLFDKAGDIYYIVPNHNENNMAINTYFFQQHLNVQKASISE